MKIFLSYSRTESKETADTIVKYLKEIGNDVFIDTSSIVGGDVWWEKIKKSIANCEVFVLLVSLNVKNRSHVENELEYAKKQNKRIIPCVPKKYFSDENLPWGLNKLNVIFYEYRDQLVQELGYAIKKIDEDEISPGGAVTETSNNGSGVDQFQHQDGKSSRNPQKVASLMNEFDESQGMYLAKQILDSYPLNPKEMGGVNCMNDEHYYNRANLHHILRDPLTSPITDPGEMALRRSFDNMLNFLGRLGFWLIEGSIVKKDILYYDFYIEQIRKLEPVIEYARLCKFYEFALLLDKLGTPDKKLEELVQKYNDSYS